MIIGSFFMVGCGGEPDEVQFYERELVQMRKAARAAEAAKLAEKEALKDGYPWRGTVRNEPDLLLRIKNMENRIGNEIECLDRAVHGRKSSKLRYRD